MRIDTTVRTPVSDSVRARQLEAMFDVPRGDESVKSWTGDMPIEDQDWSVGLIVGPSGSGKTTIAEATWGEPVAHEWGGAAVIDDFADGITMKEISDACQAVGFNTIPSWLRPYGVLSNGEQFRVDLARTLVESSPDEPIVVDEFTSVVDRQVAQIASHAVQKWVRRNDRQFVAVTCHYDVVDWLQPDWVLEPANMNFQWRSVQPRPRLEVEIVPTPHRTWDLFAPFHYLTAELHRGARCYCLLVDGEPAAFGGVLHRPHPKTKNVKGLSRLVTLPDWQGLGLAFVLVDALGSAYKACGYKFHTYPAHPALMRGFDRSSVWQMRTRPHGQSSGNYRSTLTGTTDTARSWAQGKRPNAVFRFVGPAMEDKALAECLLTTKV